MQNASGLDLIWWITAVELPALAGLFLFGWRTPRAAAAEIRRRASCRLSGARPPASELGCLQVVRGEKLRLHPSSDSRGRTS